MTEITRLFDFPYYQLEKFNLDKALTTKYDGEWKSISTQEYVDKANAISRALLKLGVAKNDKIAVISTKNIEKLSEITPIMKEQIKTWMPKELGDLKKNKI